jgi:Cadherin-like domain/Domain of unknown function (DUF4114)
VNGYINNGIATLSDFDNKTKGLSSFVSLGDNGKVSFNLTDLVSTSEKPLYLYVGEGFDNGETPDGLISASNREVGGLSDLSTDFGLPGVEDDTISMEIEFNADANTKNVYFQFAFGSEELLEYAREFNDSFSLELNGVNLATLRDGKEVTIDNLAVNSIGPYSPDLIINPASAPVNNDVKLDGYTKTLTFTGAVNPNSVNKLVITVKDNRDGLLDSAVFLKAGTFGTIAPASFNSGPTGAPTAILASTPEDTDIIINESELLLGFKDPDGDKLSIANVVANNGTLVDNGNNSFTFTPTANFNGGVNLTYDVTDGTAPLTGQKQSFSVTPVNNAPTGSPTATLPTSPEDTIVIIKPSDLLLGFSDIDKDPLTIKNLAATNGTISNNPDGTYSYTPTLDFNGAVNLTYDVTDGIETLTGQKQSFSVIPVNDAPGGKPTAILPDTLEDTAIKILASELLKTFTDIDGTTPTVSNLIATNGSLTDNKDGTYTFNPTTNFNGVVNLSYDVTDGLIVLPGQKQSFKVSPVNDAPTGSPTATLPTSPEDTIVIIKPSDLLLGFSDIDKDPLTIKNLAATNGTISNNPDGTYNFVPTLDFNGVVNLTYDVTDGIETLTGQKQSFSITPVNDAPGGKPTAILPDTLEDTAIKILASELLKTFTDKDGTTPTVNNLTATNGSLTDNKDGTYTFDPTANFNGVVNLSYDVTDGLIVLPGQKQSFKVTPVNDAPTGAPTVTLASTPEDTSITIKASDLLAGFSDIDGDTLTIANASATNGSLVDNKNGTYKFTPTSKFSGIAQITYGVTDGIATLAGQTRSFEVIKANRPPTAIALVNTLTTIAENTVIAPRRKVADIQITDDSLGVNTLSLGGTDSGSFELDGNALYLKAGTILDYEAKKNLNLVVNVDDATVGVVPDASTSFTLNITDVNEAPVRKPDTNPPSKLSDTPEDTTTTIKDSDLLDSFSDADGNNTLTIKKLGADNGKLKDNKDGTYSFTPNIDYSGVVKLNYDVTDGTNTLTGQTDKFNVIAEVPALLAPIAGESGPSGLLQLSKGSSATTSLLFSKISHLAENRNELGVFAVDDSKGTINGLLPGQNGYITEVAKRSQVVFSSLGENTTDLTLDGLSNRNLTVAANSNLGFYLGVNGSIDDLALVNNSVLNRYPSSIMLFSFTDNNAQVTQVGSKTQIAFEDAVYGDKDFNDLVFQVETVTKAAPLGVSQQGTKEIFDFTTTTTPVTAAFEIKRDAFYNDRVGFYKIEDALGSIKVGTALIKPGETGYREAIVQGRIAGIDLAGTNGQTVTSNGTFAGGALYAPFLIADSSNTYTDSSNVYTAYSVGNADKVDHIRLLADNTFGFEDLFAGGDRDFNDIIVSAKFAT